MAVVTFLFFFHKNISNELSDTEIENISLTANQQQASINGVIQSHARNLNSMAKTLLIIDTDQRGMEKYIRNLEKTLGIDTVIFSGTYGHAFLSNGDSVDVSQNPVFIETRKGSPYVSLPILQNLQEIELLRLLILKLSN